ncbi:HXXEE domain-containing protein [Pelagibius sp. Alg239-R121]|uniref:HXXEE domain-containing protein n=1 Tax=Pelagibius sp. Alg239-R121 TaxID=2993448 RepID=UPI0024A74921|nr:HXXEE domain-containing protein [Pelagibius sp. Alg239-R121]
MQNRLFQNWAYATPPIALLLIGLYPFIGTAIALPLFLSLPVYMFHQYEEHDDNRFAEFLNGMLGADKKGLSPAHVWIINVIFVWFFLLAVFHIASFMPSWSVLVAYLLAVNGVLHVAWAVKFRKYNPGLWTGILLFFPLATWIFVTIPATLTIHIFSAILVIVLHAAILILARRPA